MPNRQGHEALCRLLLGDPCTRVHTSKDAKWALRSMGPGHRKYGHGVSQDVMLALVNGWSGKELLAAFLHDLQDGVLRL